MHRPVSRVENPYSEGNCHYLVVDGDTMSPNIVEVEKGSAGSFATLQEAKSHAMALVRERIAEGMASLDRLRAIGVEIRRLM